MKPKTTADEKQKWELIRELKTPLLFGKPYFRYWWKLNGLHLRDENLDVHTFNSVEQAQAYRLDWIRKKQKRSIDEPESIKFTL